MGGKTTTKEKKEEGMSKELSDDELRAQINALIREEIQENINEYVDQIVEKRTLPLDEDKWINFDGKEEIKKNISYNKLPMRA